MFARTVAETDVAHDVHWPMRPTFALAVTD
jgi:hypothetical protein